MVRVLVAAEITTLYGLRRGSRNLADNNRNIIAIECFGLFALSSEDKEGGLPPLGRLRDLLYRRFERHDFTIPCHHLAEIVFKIGHWKSHLLRYPLSAHVP